jgi:inorganic triphosphatase YgiF
MGREVELKFALAHTEEAKLRGAAALAGVRASTTKLLTLYFDTPRGELSANGMAIRLRRARGRWAQALKASGSGTGGLHDRSEWEFDRFGPTLDLSLFADTPLAKLEDAANLHTRLAEVFRVEYERAAWILEPAPGTRVEVVLDRGEVAASGRTDPIYEVEIESLEGEVGAIFDVATRLLDEVALRPSTVSKAERGYRLRSRRRRQPEKASAIHLDKDATLLDAARTVIAAGLAQLQANEEGLLASSDLEFVHQARVALRRLRSALRIFRDAIGAERADAWRAALGDTGRALGGARDWDVFATEVMPPVLSAYGDAAVTKRLTSRVTRERRTARETARASLLSRPHALAIVEISRWLAFPEPVVSAQPLTDFAAGLIRKRHKRLVRDAHGFAGLSAAERHRLRIDVKRLRYSIDALDSLFTEKHVERYVDILVALQDGLGHANDAVTATRLLPKLEPPADFATFARGWFGAQAAGDNAAFGGLIESLVSTPRFWR